MSLVVKDFQLPHVIINDDKILYRILASFSSRRYLSKSDAAEGHSTFPIFFHENLVIFPN